MSDKTKTGKSKRAAKSGGEAKPKAARLPKTPKKGNPKRVSALDAAARVLAESAEPLNAKAIVELMAKRNLWASPKGKTPHATLAAAIVREIANKGKDSRFAKHDRGLFVAGKAP